MIYLTLALEFMKIGLFSLGGGLATVPFLSELGSNYGWFTQKELVDMIAVSESTPGPIGINMATYIGFKIAGIPGALVATLSEVLPAIVIITVIATVLSHFKDNPFINKLLKGIRPCTLALMLAAFLNIFSNSVLPINQITNFPVFLQEIDIKLILLFIGMYLFKTNTKYHPLVYIVLSAVFGIILF